MKFRKRKQPGPVFLEEQYGCGKFIEDAFHGAYESLKDGVGALMYYLGGASTLVGVGFMVAETYIHCRNPEFGNFLRDISPYSCWTLLSLFARESGRTMIDPRLFERDQEEIEVTVHDFHDSKESSPRQNGKFGTEPGDEDIAREF